MLRIAYLVVLGFISISATGQFHYLKKQISNITADAPFGFQNFIHAKDSSRTDSTFLTKYQVEGTKDNIIVKASSFCAYNAVIADSVSMKEAKQIAAEWRDKLNFITGSVQGYKMYERKIVDWNPSEYGFYFLKERVTVDVDVYSFPGNKNQKKVLLGITFYENKQE